MSITSSVPTFACKASVSFLKMKLHPELTHPSRCPTFIVNPSVPIFTKKVQKRNCFSFITPWCPPLASQASIRIPQIALTLYTLGAYLCSCKMNRNFEAYRKVNMLQLCNLAASLYTYTYCLSTYVEHVLISV
jgi:hypothetical protein